MTPKQKACLDAFKALTVDGVLPSYEQVAVHLGAARSQVCYWVDRLERDGYVSRDRYKRRSLVILERRGNLHEEVLSLVNTHGFQAVFDELYRVSARTGRRGAA